MSPAPVQQHTFSATVNLDGEQIVDSFDKFEGGDIKAESKSYRPGGMVASIILPAPQTTEAITVTRYFDAERDLPMLTRIKGKMNRPATISVSVLDADGQPKGTPQIYNGALSGIVMPKFDSTSDGAAAELGLTFTISDS